MKTFRNTAWAFVLAAGCGGTKTETPQQTAPVTVSVSSPARRVIEAARVHPEIKQRLAIGGALVRSGAGLALARPAPVPGPRVVPVGAFGFDARLPERADRPTRIVRPDRAGVWIDVQTALRPVAGEVVDGAVVFAGADVETDVIESFDGRTVEELRVLHGPRAIRPWTWTIDRGPGVTGLRLREGRVEVLEGDEVRIVSDPIVAIDAVAKHVATRTELVERDGTFALTAALADTDVKYPVVLDPAWTRTLSKLAATRTQEVPAVPLTDGRVAVFPYGASLAVEIYDPVWDRFDLGPPVLAPRSSAGAALRLPTADKVVYFGGGGGEDVSWEVWDAKTGSAALRTLAPAATPNQHAVQLKDGRLFFWAEDRGQIYDPKTDTLTATALRAGQPSPAIALLKDGRVALIGDDYIYCQSPTIKLYDPVTDTWTEGPTSCKEPDIRAATTGAGMVLHGYGKTFDPFTNTVAANAIPLTWTSDANMLGLPDGRVVFAAVGDKKQALFYDDVAGWSAASSLTMIRENPGLAPLPGGRVLVFGGGAGTSGLDVSANTAEVYSPGAKTCMSSTDCGGGPCVDGYCCDRTCGEQCFACDVPGREGFCSPLDGKPPRTGKTSCSPFLNCTKGACTDGCISAADCTSGNSCLSGVCAVKLAKGGACVNAADCETGNCVDGVCCDTGCTEQCKACNVSGKVGTCSNVEGAPVGTRTSCSPFVCSAGACVTSCTTDAQCSAGNYCLGGTCVARLSNGKACDRSTMCTSGFCADGVCCNGACDQPCRACNRAGALGTCGLVTSGTVDPRGLCVGECANGCGTTGCTYKASTTVCGVSCVGSTLTSGGRCTGTTEACAGSTASVCAGGLVCADGTKCLSACAKNTDCVSGVCDTASGGCGGVPPVDAGLADVGGDVGGPTDASGADAGGSADTSVTVDSSLEDATVDGATVDSAAVDSATVDSATVDSAPADTTVADTSTSDSTVVDSAAADGATADTAVATDSGAVATDSGWPIADAPAPGFDPTAKLPVTVQTCRKNEECPTGYCVEGVCCDSACNDRCHSCALLSNPGKCTLEPVGVDLKQECGPAYTCLGTCGGDGQCIGAGAGTMCARSRCTDASSGIGPAFCAEPGGKCSANEGVTFDCAPFACAPAFGACLSSCAKSEDCAHGFLCDLGSRLCVSAPSAEAGDDGGGGCSVGAAGRSSDLGLVGLGVAAAALAAARRRRSVA